MGDRIASFKEKVEKNPNQVFFRYSLAQAYFEEGAFEQASAEFRKCLEVRPDWMMASLFVGKAEMEIRQFPACKGIPRKDSCLGRRAKLTKTR